MRKFAFISLLSAILLSTLAHAQQFDLAVGASTLFSSRNTNASQAFLPAAEKGGVYGSASADLMLNHRFGINAEIVARSQRGLYNNYQEYRPVLYDVNGVFARRVGERTTVQLLAGVGAQTVLFGSISGFCNYPAGCAAHANGTQLLAHVGIGARYTVWREIFVRPEAHFYRVINNDAFHSDNVFRLGVSIGYTFGGE